MANPNCNGLIEVNFSSYIVVNSTMKVKHFDQTDLDQIPMHIAINAESLFASVLEENYCPIGGVSVPNPCNPVTPITVPCVTLNEVIVSGPINYVVGADVIEPANGRATMPGAPGVTVEIDPPSLEYKTASASGSTFIDNEILLYLNNLNDPAPNLKVTVSKLSIINHLESANGDNYYEVLGTFKIQQA